MDWNNLNIESIASGNTQEINLLYKHSKNYFMFLYGDEELFNDIVVKAVQNIALFDHNKGLFSNWLLKIGERVSIDYHRKNKQTKTDVSISDVIVIQSEEESTESERYYRNQYVKAYNLLSPDQQKVLETYLNNNSIKTPKEKVTFFRIKEKLNRLMDKPIM